MGKNRIRVISSLAEEEGIKIPQYEEIEINDGYTRIFYDSKLLEFYFKAKKASIVLLHYLLLEGRQSEFHFGQSEYNKFQKFCHKNNCESYHRRIIINSLRELVQYEILFKRTKGYYLINAKYFYSGVIKGRQNKISSDYEKLKRIKPNEP